MRSRIKHLKVKIKSLAAESKIIRKEEFRAPSQYERNNLALHRRGIVRSTARHSLLAYGFLRGRSYAQMEGKAFSPPNWDQVRKDVEKFGVCGIGDDAVDFPARRAEQWTRWAGWLLEAERQYDVAA